MVRHGHYPQALRGRVFRGSDVVRRGLLTPAQLRTARWRGLFRDVYADAALHDSHLIRCAAATLILPSTAVFTGRSAACLRGLPLGEPQDAVQVLVPRGSIVRIRGVRSRQGQISAEEVVPGRPLVTTPERTAWEIGSEHDLIGAVAALDVLLRHGYVTPDRLALSAAANPRSRAARAIRLADGRAESPPESELRVRFALAGLPPPIPQFDVRHGGAFVARLDLGWPKRKVGCEYDGEHHAELRQFRADRTRLNKLVDAGWTIVHASARDLADKDRFDRLVAQLRSVLGRN